MKKSIILSGILGLGVIIASGFGVASSSGIAYYTGSPTDGGTCSGCHRNGTATPAGSITASPAFGGSGNNLTYVPGTTYTITVVQTNSSYPDYGFDMEIMNTNSSSGTTDAGTMTAIANCKNNGTGPTNITHKARIATNTGATIKWVAPSSGTAYLYAAILGVNADGGTSGDKVMNFAYVLTPAATTQVPVAAFTSSGSSACVGQTITLTDNSTNTPTSWTWTMTGGTPATSNSQNPTVSYSAAGTYSITLVSKNAGGSSTPVTKAVTINALPNVASTSTTICSGNSANLTASGATSYAWNTGGTSATLNVSPTTSTTYTVTGTTNGCSSTATGVVTVNPLPNVAATSTAICTGGSANLTASGATSYSWNTGGTSATLSVSPTANTTYTVTGTSNGCSKTATAVVTVNSIPNVAATSTTICSGSTANLTASGAATYAWNTGGTSATLNVSPTTNTTYTVTGTSNGCSKTATAVVTVNPLPVISVPSETLCTNSQSSTTLTASGATTYSWSSGCVTPTCVVSPTVTTTYTVAGVSNGCAAVKTAVVTVKSCTTTGIDTYNIANQVNIFPNPANEFLNISLGLLSGIKTAELYDVSGRLVMAKDTEGTSLQLDLTSIEKGSYFVKVMNDKAVVAVKMVIISK